MRHRTYTEMVGTLITKPELDALKAIVRARKLTMSEYLREQAIRPLLAQAEGQGNIGGGLRADAD